MPENPEPRPLNESSKEGEPSDDGSGRVSEPDPYRKLEDNARGLREMSGQKRKPPAMGAANTWARHVTAGMQFVLVILLPIGGGYWLDTKLDSLPWFTLAGFALGATGATVSLVKEVQRMNREDERRKK